MTSPTITVGDCESNELERKANHAPNIRIVVDSSDGLRGHRPGCRCIKLFLGLIQIVESIIHALIQHFTSGIAVDQPYFANAARHLLYAVMMSFMLRRLDWTYADMLRALANPGRCRSVLEQHPYTSNIVERYYADERLLNDVFSTIATKVLVYEAIAGSWEKATDRVSLNAWANEEIVLILGNTEISRNSIDNINRCLFKRASDLVLAKREGTTERTWFFVDELSEAGRLPLTSLLKKGRSKSARVAIAYQSISGLRDPKLFGQHVTDDLLGQIGNRFFGRIECPETAEYAARVIGDQEIQQVSSSETRSRQGSSRTKNTAQVVRRAVLPSEFMSLDPCDATNGLTGMFTTRSAHPCWDHLAPDELFGMVLSPAENVPDFVPRDPFAQLVMPWTPEDELRFAPPLSRKNRPQPSQNREIDPADPAPDERLNTDDLDL